MKHGDILGKDAYGRNVKVGDLVDTNEWYGLNLSVSRKMVIGITGGSNYRVIHPYINADTKACEGYIGWEYIKRPLISPKETLDSKTTQGYYTWMNNYMMLNQCEAMFNDFMLGRFTPKGLKQYKLEITDD